MTAVAGNASVYQVYPVSRMTGEGRAEYVTGKNGLVHRVSYDYAYIIGDSFVRTGIRDGNKMPIIPSIIQVHNRR